MKSFSLFFLLISNIVLSAQDFLVTPSFNNLLGRPRYSNELSPRSSKDSTNYIFTFLAENLPFIDEFSTNRQRPQNNQLPNPANDYYVVGKCTKLLDYKMGAYKFSKTVSSEDIFDPMAAPNFVTPVNTTPILYSLNDSPNCTNLVLELIYPPSIKRRYTSTGKLLWDSIIGFDTTIYAARVKEYTLKGFLWTDRHAYINSHLAFCPPSKGVATLDGLNEYGRPYSKVGKNVNGPADFLTSAPIDLSANTGSDSVYLSFLIQPQGFGDNPDIKDSIVVEFLDDRGRWNPVWTRKGNKELPLDSLKFSFVSIHIPDPIVASDPVYFYNRFQFRFKNYATISGINDLWHLDFVRLDANRGYLDTTISDFNFVYELPSVLKKHTLLPSQQYRGRIDLEDTICGKNRNIQPAVLFGGYKFNCINENSGVVYGSNNSGIPYSRDLILDLCLSTANDLNYPLTVVDSTYITTKLFFDNSDSYRDNDTATNRQLFFNEMAYDDGSAEWSYGVGGYGTTKVAYRFFVPNKDTLAAVKIMFTNTIEPVENLVFNLNIWKTIGINGNEEKVIKTISNLKPTYIDSLNSFITFGLDAPIEVQDTIYIGWEQSDERNLQIGYDANSTKGFENIFVRLNNVWSKTNVIRKGSPMIRLVLDGVRNYTTNSVVETDTKIDKKRIEFYPNPASQTIYFELNEPRKVEVNVFDLLGKLVIRQSIKEGQLNVSNLVQGFYFVQFSEEGQMIQTDKLQIIK